MIIKHRSWQQRVFQHLDKLVGSIQQQRMKKSYLTGKISQWISSGRVLAIHNKQKQEEKYPLRCALSLLFPMGKNSTPRKQGVAQGTFLLLFMFSWWLGALFVITSKEAEHQSLCKKMLFRLIFKRNSFVRWFASTCTLSELLTATISMFISLFWFKFSQLYRSFVIIFGPGLKILKILPVFLCRRVMKT